MLLVHRSARFAVSCAARSLCVLAAVVTTLGTLAAPAAADAFSNYGDSYRAFSTPPIGDGSFSVAGAALPDGRLLMVTGNSVYLETGIATATFNEVAILDASQTGGSTDPAFLSISPDGSRIAIGTGFGKPVAVFATSALGTPNAPTTLTSGSVADYFAVGHFDAAWYDNTSLALTAGNFGQPAFVSLLDTASDPNNPTNPLVITNIQGASAGIAFDDDGRLYTANGFANGNASDTGNIRAFDAADWLGGADFEAEGILIGDVLSGNALRFDAEGNLLVGGGDFGNFDAGYLGVVNADALADALAGFGPIDSGDAAQLARLDPRGDGFGFFSSAYNAMTGELYVTDSDTWYATIPAPTTLALLVTAGVFAGRRRRG